MKDIRLTFKYKTTKLFPRDNIGTIRTGQEWFDRYMIYPWEQSGFIKVES